MCKRKKRTSGHLERLGGVRFLGEVRRLDLLGERRLRLLVLRLRGLSGLLALFFPLHMMPCWSKRKLWKVAHILKVANEPTPKLECA